jgi:hypothetical protein
MHRDALGLRSHDPTCGSLVGPLSFEVRLAAKPPAMVKKPTALRVRRTSTALGVTVRFGFENYMTRAAEFKRPFSGYVLW